MELTVYRQSSRERPDGTIVYKGEDARPFVNDNIFFVADGLGGAAAIRHQSITPDLFDDKKLLDTLFRGVYEEYDDEVFVKYVTDSFYELFAVKDCYTENVNNIKKSGYFASRIVTAILLHEMIYNGNLKTFKLFELYNSMESMEKKHEVLKNLGDYFATKIRDDMRKIAKNANLYYESSYSGLALLGSTLCATIYREIDDAVEAIYLTAGDSRPYIWTEGQGLCQIIEDQEGKDGGMTNYIKANDGETFNIRCNYMLFKKPCVLFNASDGCFDSGFFLSQMAFEKLILEKAIASSDTASMGKSIYEAFLTYGRHDDSSTLAMKFFGYDSFSSFKDCALRRLNCIRSDYLTKMPDVLEHDYIAEYNENTAKMPCCLADIKTRFKNEKAVEDFCFNQMKLGKYAPFESSLCIINAKIEEEKKKIIRASENVEQIVARNYVRFITDQVHLESRSEKRAVSKINCIVEKYQSESTDFVASLEEYRTEFKETTDRMKCIFEQLFDIGVPSDFSDFDKINISAVEECDRSMASVFDFLYAVKKKRQDAIRQLAQLKNDYITQNIKLASSNVDNFHKICSGIISGSIDIGVIFNRILQNDLDNLKQELFKIVDAEKTISSLKGEEKVKALRDCQDKYWEENYVSIITSIVSNLSVPIPEDLRNEARIIVDEMNEKAKGLQKKAELQSRLFQLYDDSYSRYLGGSQE